MSRVTSTAVDDVWSAGYVGLYRYPGGSSAQQFDNVQIFIDNDEDGILDAADDIEIDDDFNSGAMSLSYDSEADQGGRANGNLTDDGLFKYVYDAWNRLVEVTRRVDAETTVAQYEYDGQNRRTQKVVTNSGVEDVPNDGGNTTVHFYYGGVAAGLRTGRNVPAGLRTGRNVAAGAPAGRWNVFETRNGSSQTTFQYVWGQGGTGFQPVSYVDELVMIDKNGDPTESNDCDPDDQTAESTADARYFVHQDRNWNVVALTEYDPNATNNARIIERYTYTPYGQFIVLNGDAGSAELGNVLPTSTLGNPFTHQGLAFDQDKDSYQNRHREYVARLQRFAQRDPVAFFRKWFDPSRHYTDGMSLYECEAGNPLVALARRSGSTRRSPSQPR